MLILKTNRLIVRQFRLSDAEAMNRVFGDAAVMRFGDGPQSPEWVYDWLSRCFENYRQRSGLGVWAVVEKGSAETMGYCGLFFFPDVGGQPETELGYRLARSYWGRGYATEAARAVRDYAFNTLRLPRLIALIDPQNVASIRVAEKLGMTYEKEVMLADYTHPDRVYVIERSKTNPIELS
jgi:RimJ/RimL family protein N-acetyltransferase